MRISDDYILKNIVGDYIVVPIGDSVDINSMISVNESGVRIWNMIEDNKSLDEIADNFVTEYGISKQEAINDIDEFLKEMTDNGILIND